MKAQITSFKTQQSKYGQTFYYVFFKDENGKSFRSCIYVNMRNFEKWKSILKSGMVLDNLRLKQKGLIDADSNFNVVGIREFTKPKIEHVIIEKKPIWHQTQMF
tara:strand:- start:272 stop:583 length:312 start_codon:yes stop_codon:yes gene_type:complete